jgi:hypothetical protein
LKPPIFTRARRLLAGVTDALKASKPLHLEPDAHIFRNRDGEPLNFHTWRAKDWYRALRATGIRERKPYSTRHTFISVGLSNGVNIKWLAEYCGTSVAMIAKHYGKYIGGDVDEQFSRLLGAKTETLTETPAEVEAEEQKQVAGMAKEDVGGPTWIRTRTETKKEGQRISPGFHGNKRFYKLYASFRHIPIIPKLFCQVTKKP